MKLVRTETLVSAGTFPSSREWQTIYEHLQQAIKSVQWPPGSGSFVLYDESGKKPGEGSGVTPIKKAFCENLKRLGWQLNKKVDFYLSKEADSKPGAIDATYPVGQKLFAVEWETGNISSSHRAINKMVLGMMSGKLIGGALVLPTKKMSYYITDRVGRYEELEPYFALWKSLKCNDGLLMVMVVEHDAVSKNVERIPKGTNGRARR